ncbi:MAG TPA: rod shape-determining protein MreC [Bacteroidales bacterium]|nr:rod shape-determining protein MreC [Bacteroidales bacterium]
MRNLLNFLARYNALFLFILLEGIALYIVVTRNEYHNSRVIKGMRGITVLADQRITNTRNYLRLRYINTGLALENAELRNKVSALSSHQSLVFFSVSDTGYHQQYEYTSATLVNNTVSRQKNFFTIDKGKKQGVDAGMGVTGQNGVAGIIVGSSDNFSVAMSLLNLDFRLSSRIKSNGYFGSLTWDGRDYRYAMLNEIPQHVSIVIGDTIESTGYSAVFPEGIMVGVISDFERSGSDFYRIKVALATNFRQLSHVSVIRNLKKEEQEQLEKRFR